MRCSRCSGFMVEAAMLDMEGGFGEMWATSWRCVNCSHTHDPTIERNRLAQQQGKVLALSSGGPDHRDHDVSRGPKTNVRLAA